MATLQWERFSGYWERWFDSPIHVIVVVLLALFLILQLGLSFRHWRAMRRGRRCLLNLRGDDRFVPGTAVADAAVRDVSWIRWIADRIQDGALTERRIERDDALKELDVWLESHPPYLLLQRTAIMAPLFGLLITVGGFFLFEPSSTTTSNIAQILRSLTPLVLGVGAGALLAFFNQWLLHWAGLRCDMVRKAGRDWFDSCVWRHVATPAAAESSGVVRAMSHVAKVMRTTASEFQVAARGVTESTSGMQKSVERTQQSLDGLQGTLVRLPEVIQSLRSTSTEAVRGLTGIVPRVADAVAVLNESADGFQKSVKEDFQAAAERCGAVATQFSDAVGRIQSAVGQLESSSGALSAATQAQADCYRDLSRSVAEELVPASVSYRSAGEQLAESTSSLREQAGRLGSLVDGLVARADQVGPRAVEAVDALSHTAAEMRLVVRDQLGGVVTEFQTMTNSLAEVGAGLNEGVADLNRRCHDLGDAAAAQTDAAGLLKSSLEQTLVPAHASLQETVSTLKDTTGEFAQRVGQFTETLDASGERLATLLPEVSRAVGLFLPAVTDFHDAVENEFAAAATECRTVLGAIGKSAEEVHEGTRSLAAACGVFQESVRAQGETVESLSESIAQAVVPANSSLHESAVQLQEGVSSLTGQITAFRGGLERSADGLGAVVETFSAFATEARNSTADLGPAVDSLASTSAALAESSTRLGGSVGVLSERCEGLNASASAQTTAATRLTESVEQALLPANASLQAMVGSLSGSTSHFVQRVEQFSTTLDESTRALGELLPAATQAAAQFPPAVTAFQAAVDNGFAAAADDWRNVVRAIGGFSERLEQGVATLAGGCETFRNSAQQYNTATGEFSQSLDQTLIPANAAVQQLMGQLQQGAAALLERYDSFGTEMRQSMGRLTTVVDVLGTFASHATDSTAQLQPAVDSLASIIERDLYPLVQTCRDGVNGLQAASGSLRGVVEGMTSLTNSLESIVAEHHSTSEQLEPAYGAVRETLERFDELSRQVSQSMDGQVRPLHDSLAGAVDTFRGSAEDLATFIRDGVEPATRNLADLAGTVERLREQVESLRAGRPDARFRAASGPPAPTREAPRLTTPQIPREPLTPQESQPPPPQETQPLTPSPVRRGVERRAEGAELEEEETPRGNDEPSSPAGQPAARRRSWWRYFGFGSGDGQGT